MLLSFLHLSLQHLFSINWFIASGLVSFIHTVVHLVHVLTLLSFQSQPLPPASLACSHLITLITHLFIIPLITPQYIYHFSATSSVPDCPCARGVSFPASIYIPACFLTQRLYSVSASAQLFNFVCLPGFCILELFWRVFTWFFPPAAMWHILVNKIL